MRRHPPHHRAVAAVATASCSLSLLPDRSSIRSLSAGRNTRDLHEAGKSPNVGVPRRTLHPSALERG